MERVYEFLPSIIVIACIAALAILFFKLLVKYFGDNLRNTEWVQKNKLKAYLLCVLRYHVVEPTVEELVYRAPLVLVFSTVSSFAWYVILAVSGAPLLFSLFLRRSSDTVLVRYFMGIRNVAPDAPDASGASRMSPETAKKADIACKVFGVVSAVSLGIVSGYYGILYQSIWLSVGIHAAWNVTLMTVMPVVGLLAMLTGCVVFYETKYLWDEWSWRRKATRVKRRYG